MEGHFPGENDGILDPERLQSVTLGPTWPKQKETKFKSCKMLLFPTTHDCY